MIIHSGMRTDIPAFYSEWFMNRIREGYVMTRNPYNRNSVSRYALDPEVVDLLCFCTKNPAPMVKYLSELDSFRQYWQVTITPYGRDIEPGLGDKNRVMDAFRKVSEHVGKESIAWRYDPIFLDSKYTVEYHESIFEQMARRLAGYTDTCIISFIDLYEKVKRNFPEAKKVGREEQMALTGDFVQIGRKYGMTIKPCAEGEFLAECGADMSGCMSRAVMERAAGSRLEIPGSSYTRAECGCVLAGDIGEYNTCMHLCRYCYANYSEELVRENRKKHDPLSPLLIGHLQEDDVIHEAVQKSWLDPQLSFI